MPTLVNMMACLLSFKKYELHILLRVLFLSNSVFHTQGTNWVTVEEESTYW